MSEATNKPNKVVKTGRFQISIWKSNKLIKAKNDFDVEREVEQVRTCVQYSRFNKENQIWNNQRIWCTPHEIRDLAQCLDKLNE